MASDRGIVGIFPSETAAAKAVRELAAAGVRDMEVYSPIPSEEIEEALGGRGSPVPWFTLAGALAGVVLGYGLSLYAASKWELVVSGKPLQAWIPFTVVAFELAVLLGALGNFAAMLLFGGLGRFGKAPGYDSRFSRDKCGVFVPVGEGGLKELGKLLADCGAEETREVGLEG